MSASSLYDIKLPALTGEQEIDFSAYRGKVVLVANTASKCGFTAQYEGLQYLWALYRQNGFAVIGIPSDSFAQQEFATNSEIDAFCSNNYGVSFPMTAKLPVRGDHACDFFQWVRRHGSLLAQPRWNFYKYLISRDGKLLQWFSPLAKPDSRRVEHAILRALYL